MKTTMARISPLWFMLLIMPCFIATHAYKAKLPLRTISSSTHNEAMLQLNAFKASFTIHDSIASQPSSFSPSPSPSPTQSQVIIYQSCMFLPFNSIHL